MKKILITGTDGFIGSQLKSSLEEYTTYQIYTLNENIFINENWFEDVELMLHSIRPDVIFHIGACSDTLEQNVNYMMTLNFESTKILMDYSKNHNIPLIYSSSAANYGTNNKYPSNLYGWSKYVAEQYVISNGGVGLRYFNVYGPGEQNKGRMASVAYQMFIKNKNGEKISLFPNKPSRDFVYVKDVLSANIYAWENYNDVCGNYYEVGSGIANTFESVMHELSIDFDYVDESMIPKGYQYYTCSNSNLWMNGWVPKWTLKNGINDYIKTLKTK